MTPFYWESAHGNFGDDLNLWLWDFLLPGFRDVHPEVLLVGVGTVLNGELLPPGRKLVIGSGYGYGTLPDIGSGEWDVRCVRGPGTAKALGLDESLGIIDPAVMLGDMPEFQNVAKTGRPIFIPHWESAVSGIWSDVSRAAGLVYVDPCGEAKSVITAIAGASLVVAESMHAAIIADALRVPWVAVSTSTSINKFKWSDWTETVGTTYDPLPVPITTRAEAIQKGTRFWGIDHAAERTDEAALTGGRADPEGDARRRGSGPRRAAKFVLALPAVLALRRAKAAKPQLSDASVLAARKDRFRNVLAEIRRDYL